jgi:hypothetical protein
MLVLKCIVGAVIGFFVGGLLSLPISWAVHEDVYNFIWPVFELAGAAVGIACVFYTRQKEQELRDRENRNRLRQYREQQQTYYQRMLEFGEHSITLFESMPDHLKTAEEWLDQAAVDFAQGAFSPFWSSIENAAKSLAHFDEAIGEIKSNSSQFTELVPKYRDTPPAFPVSPESVEKLRVGTSTAKRMEATVRHAQCNYQFATIYEQRKTNQILIAGFTNLAHALDYMTTHITNSIANLSSSFDGMSSTLNEAMRTIHSEMRDSAEAANKRHKEMMVRETRVIVMLDNIQRRRRPTL